MAKSYDYLKTIKLKNNEVAAKVNKDTGETTIIESMFNKLPEGLAVYKNGGKYRKTFEHIESYLLNKLKPIEYNVVCVMGLMAAPVTNSLAPIDDNISKSKLAEFFNVDRRQIEQVLKTLFDIGVYGKFHISEQDKNYKIYWVLNPYVSYKGKLIDSDVIGLFKNTEIANVHFKYIQQNTRQQVN